MGSQRKKLLIVASSIIFFIIVPVISMLSGRLLDQVLEYEPLHSGWFGLFFASILLLVGGYYVIESIRILLVSGGGIPLGDLLPGDQSTTLITTGIYSQTRNPMLFGYLLCLIALGIFLESISTTLIIPAIFILLWTIWLKKMEEPALETRFGDKYRKYRIKTPFLVPRPWREKDD